MTDGRSDGARSATRQPASATISGSRPPPSTRSRGRGPARDDRSPHARSSSARGATCSSSWSAAPAAARAQRPATHRRGAPAGKDAVRPALAAITNALSHARASGCMSRSGCQARSAGSYGPAGASPSPYAARSYGRAYSWGTTMAVDATGPSAARAPRSRPLERRRELAEHPPSRSHVAERVGDPELRLVRLADVWGAAVGIGRGIGPAPGQETDRATAEARPGKQAVMGRDRLGVELGR